VHKDKPTIHTPVLVEEVLAHFQPNNGDYLLDVTLGTGGHAKAFLDATTPDGKVIGLDADPDAIKQAQKQLSEYGTRVSYINTNFTNLKDSIIGGGIVQESPMFSHILFDLGLGSHQLADPKRGFSIQSQSSISMHYGNLDNLPDSQFDFINKLTKRLGRYPEVLDLINYLYEDQLADVIYVYGEERYSRRIAKGIKQSSEVLETPEMLADLVAKKAPRGRSRIHPATRTFQALRLAVNRELEALTFALPQALDLLKPNGHIAVISFHSLEDRIVKHYFRDQAKAGRLEVLTKKPQRATEEEIKQNPRSRSAKLRVAQKKTNKTFKQKQTHDSKNNSKYN
jgi:16S rRNA (cytosine1402-N4)-methyltransferase